MTAVSKTENTGESRGPVDLTCETIRVRLASPRGFCAGVDRAIRTVEDALTAYGAPVFVRHEIVHNAHVVDRLAAMGAVFIENLDDAEPGRPVIFSAHGVGRSIYEEARSKSVTTIDATCPLVLKVHHEIKRWAARDHQIALIGHAGHPEVVGAMDQVDQGRVTLVETVEDAHRVAFTGAPLAYATQTTLSVDDTREIINILKQRFPHMQGPRTDDICYATTNRQTSVKAIAPGCDIVLVIGDPQSSNSRRLVEAAKEAGARQALLIPDPETVDINALDAYTLIGVTAGASAPESLVERLLARIAERRQLVLEHVETARETLAFKQPPMPVLS